MSDFTGLQDINITSTVGVSVKDGKARVSIPRELRLTENLLNFINACVKEQGLELGHLDISEEHCKELEKIPNVSLQPEAGGVA